MNPYHVEEAPRCDVEHLVRKHYLHKWPGVVTSTIGLYDENDFGAIGVIVFALPPPETCKRYGVTLAWELARLFIEDTTPKNAETWFMSRSIALIRRKRPEVELLVSYADPSANHSGVIYRAGNWIADGQTDDDRTTPRCDYYVGERKYGRWSHVPIGATVTRRPRVSKNRFIYWMRGHEKKRAAK